MKKKLSRKITFFIVLILLLVISIIILFSYHFFKNFYKDQLVHEVTEELLAYGKMLEEGLDETIVSYIVIERNRDRNDMNTVFFDESLRPIYASNNVSQSWLNEYQDWIKGQETFAKETLHYVDTGIGSHIPHIWAYEPIITNGQLKGFFFIDKDTGEFEKAKQQLALLLLGMGLFTLIIGILLTHYLTKVISKPLVNIGDATRKIAEGNFDVQLAITSDDEMGLLADDIRAMTRQLKDFRDSRRQFISNISHDLRTPITYIKGYSAVMKDFPNIEEEVQRNLEVIYNEAKRMEYLVSDLFQLTRLEEGKITLHKEETNLVLWLETIVASRQLMLDNHSITCKVEANKPEIVAFIDQQRLGQAVINIIENSIRYTPKNGMITIHIDENEDYITIKIEDNGIGINEEDLPHIWERFYRADKSRSRASGGSGLGLAIVKEIVEIHGGRVDVESVEGKGSSFYVYLLKNMNLKRSTFY